jgi:hypothetical protein
MLNQELFLKYYGILASRFPSIGSNADVAEVYYELLTEELNDRQFEFALKKIIRDCDFFPSPKQIIEAAPSLDSLIRAEMDRLDLPCYLPADWRDRIGKTYILDLTTAEKQEYLAHIQKLQPAIAPSKP